MALLRVQLVTGGRSNLCIQKASPIAMGEAGDSRRSSTPTA